jgi:carboxyl-terminal processing protease
MTAAIRALIAALVVAVVALGGATYIAYRTGIDAAVSGLDANGMQLASTGSLGDLLDAGRDGGQLVDLTFRQVEKVFYKPVDGQTLADGERAGLLGLLKQQHVANASLPPAGVNADQDQGSQLRQTLAYAQTHYAKALRGEGDVALTEAAMRGIAAAVGDPYTEYLSPREIKGLNESLSGGNFGGIGVYIYQLKDNRVIVQPIEGLPAAAAGMKLGEIVVRIDGKSIAGLSLDRVEQMIRGSAGTVVHLQTYPLKTPKISRAYAIVRQIVHVPTVKATMENGYEYIRLSEFGETSPTEVRNALLDGQAHNARGYILDLRNNGGGLLDAAVRISSLFIPQGAIVSQINRDGAREEQDALGTSIGGLRPLVVLVNKYTASASEITAGAIQDYGVGTLIGTRTFGKGIVQSIYPMPDGGALKITTARYVTPMGRDIHHRGLVPDIVIDQDPALVGAPGDKQLAAAKARLARSSR